MEEDFRHIDREYAYRFLSKLAEKNEGDAVGTLVDVIIDYVLFPQGDGSGFSLLTEFEKEIARLMQQKLKVQAIQRVRQVMGLDLIQSKEYLDRRIWPVEVNENNKDSVELQQRIVGCILKKIGKDYRIEINS